MGNFDIKELASRLVTFLEKSKNDKGIMADLRAATSEATAYRSWKHLAAFGGIDSPYSKMVCAVARLYALYPRNGDVDENFGSVVKRISDLRLVKGKSENADDSRMRRLLASDRNDIADNVLRFGGYIKNIDGLKINYARLLEDMYFWSDNVKMHWANSYYAPKTKKGDITK